MTEQRTVPHGVPQLPVRALEVVVVDGPNRGVTHTADSDAMTIGSAQGNDLVLDDDTVSRFHLELTRQPNRIVVRDCGSTNGTSLYDAQITEAAVVPGTKLQIGRSTILVQDGAVVQVEVHDSSRLGPVVGESPVMRKLMARLKRVAPSDVSVILIGETGTGKEVIARAIHESSARVDGPMETVDCGSLHPTLISSELFGHEKGAFTGADRQYIGAFERANGGTIFLDEIGELPSAVQSTLLGALERRRFRRVGGSDEIEVDVRVVSATHRDLLAEVNASSFRQDLFYRLAVVMLRVPPLRARLEDLRILSRHFLEEIGYAGALEDIVPQETLLAWETHPWPGNARELRNLVEATLALGEPAELFVSGEVSEEIDYGFPDALLEQPYKAARNELLDRFELEYVRALLDRSNGNAAAGARAAKMNRSYLFELIRKHRLR